MRIYDLYEASDSKIEKIITNLENKIIRLQSIIPQTVRNKKLITKTQQQIEYYKSLLQPETVTPKGKTPKEKTPNRSTSPTQRALAISEFDDGDIITIEIQGKKQHAIIDYVGYSSMYGHGIFVRSPGKVIKRDVGVYQFIGPRIFDGMLYPKDIEYFNINIASKYKNEDYENTLKKNFNYVDDSK